MASVAAHKDPFVERVVQRIADAVHPQQIFLFGSRAGRKSRPESDIDLLLIYDGPLSKREVKLRIHKLFREDYVPMDVFVLTPIEMESLKSIANTLAREVAETGVLYYG